MQAITTRYIAATNTKPTRIKAECERGSVIVSVDYGEEDQHEKAKSYLCGKFASEDLKEYGSPIASNPWMKPTVQGVTKNGDHVHVFI